MEDDLGCMVDSLTFPDEQSDYTFHSYRIRHLYLCNMFRKFHFYGGDTLPRTWGHYIRCLFLITFNPSYSGRKALQVLHIGSGIPVSILRKTMVSGGKDIVAQTIEACMVLNSGSHIIIEVMDHPTLDICQTTLSPVLNHDKRELSKGIETISGSNVISVTVL
jgi:hypothetical protein